MRQKNYGITIKIIERWNTEEEAYKHEMALIEHHKSLGTHLVNATLGGRTKTYLLNQYLGLNKKQIEAIDNIEGRAITILKSYPMVMIAEKEIQLVKNLGKP